MGRMALSPPNPGSYLVGACGHIGFFSSSESWLVWPHTARAWGRRTETTPEAMATLDIEALTAADTVAYRLVAISDSEAETSTVTRTGVWQAAAEAATLTTEISVVEKSNSVSPFGQVADALANSDRPSTKVDLVLADGVVTATVEGRSPEVIPAGPKGDITARAMDPNETLLKPLIRAFIQLETGVSMDGGVSYDAVFDADAVSALAVDASLRERLMATGGLTGVGAPPPSWLGPKASSAFTSTSPPGGPR